MQDTMYKWGKGFTALLLLFFFLTNQTPSNATGLSFAAWTLRIHITDLLYGIIQNHPKCLCSLK